MYHNKLSTIKILVLTHDVPSPILSDLLPFYHFIKYLSLSGHKITLLTFNSNPHENKELINILDGYCTIDVVETEKSKSIYHQITHTTCNIFERNNISQKLNDKTFPNLLDYYYDPEMQKKVTSYTSTGEFNIIYSARTMANYIQNVQIPKVVQPFDATYEWNRQMFINSNGILKFVYYIMYKMAKNYESNNYKKFDACIFVTEKDKELINSLSPEVNCVVIPNGVDTEYFKPINVIEDFPSLVYVSDMSGQTTVTNVTFFYDKIYPYIQKEVPKTKIYLVGRNPRKEISDLASNNNIIVTGTVEDVRPYIAKSSIFIAPMTAGTGIKNKVLEAMAMGKAVVTTTIGAQGISGVSGKEFLVTDDPNKFANFVVQLLNDNILREQLGKNARLLIEESYSWENCEKKLNDLFNSLVNVT